VARDNSKNKLSKLHVSRICADIAWQLVAMDTCCKNVWKKIRTH